MTLFRLECGSCKITCDGAIIRDVCSDHSTERSSKTEKVTFDDSPFCVTVINVSATVNQPAELYLCGVAEHRMWGSRNKDAGISDYQ